MALQLKQSLNLSQQLIMTPQLQQAIKLLQLSRLELLDNITQEMESNPVSESEIESLTREFGLDKPMHMQYLRWLNNVSPIGFGTDENGEATGFGFKVPDLGMSFAKNRPVIDLVAAALPITLLLNLITLPFVFVLSIVMGVYTARFRGEASDVGIGTANLALWSGSTTTPPTWTTSRAGPSSPTAPRSTTGSGTSSR